MKTIGLLLETTGDDFGKESVKGSLDGMAGTDAQLVCITGGILGSRYGYEGRRNLAYDLVSPRWVDGLLLTGVLSHYMGDRNLDDLCQRFRPLPVVTVSVTTPGSSSVMVDNRRGVGALMDHLLQFHGLRKLAYVGGPRGQQEAESRRASFLEKMEAQGLAVPEGWMVEGDFTQVSGITAARKLVETLGLTPGSLPFEGIAVANDVMALGLMEYLGTQGWKFPGDCVVVGFDDHPRSQSFEPPLTTVAQSPAQLTALGTQKLLEIFDGPTPVTVMNLVPELVVRRSCGCPAPPPGQGTETELAVCQQAFLSVSREKSRVLEMVDRLRVAAENLQSTGSFGELLQTLEDTLDRLGFPAYWLSLLEDPTQMTGTARLHLCRPPGQNPEISVEGVPYTALDLVPGGLPPQPDRSRFRVVEVLHSREQVLGFLVLDTDLGNSGITGNLRGLVSGSLQSVLWTEDRKLAERRLAQSEKMSALGSLVAGVAHELNTPLGVAITASSYLDERLEGFLRNFQSRPVTRSEFEAFLVAVTQASGSVQVNLQRAADLVATFKLVSADQDNEVRREFQVVDYLSMVLQSHRFQLQSAGVEVRLTGDETLSMVSYPGALYRVISTLLSNSLVHGFPKDRGGVVRLGIEDRGRQILLWFEDNGVGIPEDHQPRIFEPFFTTIRGHGGLGLGLHTVFNVVTNILGGSIVFRSVPGLKTRFEILIPKEGSDQGQTRDN